MGSHSRQNKGKTPRPIQGILILPQSLLKEGSRTPATTPSWGYGNQPQKQKSWTTGLQDIPPKWKGNEGPKKWIRQRSHKRVHQIWNIILHVPNFLHTKKGWRKTQNGHLLLIAQWHNYRHESDFPY